MDKKFNGNRNIRKASNSLQFGGGTSKIENLNHRTKESGRAEKGNLLVAQGKKRR